jgi:hypothetical protein
MIATAVYKNKLSRLNNTFLSISNKCFRALKLFGINLALRKINARGTMIIEALEIGTLLALLISPFFFLTKKRKTSVKFPKNYNDTSDAHYAVNERGFLEEIHHDRLSNEA